MEGYMLSDHRWRKHYFIVLTILALVLLLVLGSHFALANKDTPSLTQSAETNSPTGWGDDGIFEVGVEWENIFPDPASNVAHLGDSCDGLMTWLHARNWIQTFRFTNYEMWEADAMNESLGGLEDTYVDNVDFAMICTHGGIEFDPKWQKTLRAISYGSTHIDQHLSPGEAYLAYGDKDLEFLAIDACRVLSDDSFIYWASTLDGLHLLLGYKTNLYTDYPGDGFYLGVFMTMPNSMSVAQAWFTAVDYNQPGVACARIIGERASNFNEHWWNTWPDPTVDSEKWIWDHCSRNYTNYANPNDQVKITTMPIVQVLPRVVNKDYVNDIIAPAFNMSGDIGMDDVFYTMADTTGGITRTLLVDSITGSFSYHNQSELWTTPIVTPTLPDEKIALTLVDDWFSTTPAEWLPGSTYRNNDYFYDPESLFSILLQTKNGDLQGSQTNNIPTDIAMTYPRTIAAIASTTAGSQLVDFPTFGPGARMVVYLGDHGKIIGAQGGSRDVHVMADQVTVLDPDQVWSMYLANRNLAIVELPMEADTITHTTPTLGYYEMPYILPQHQLIPVWQFRSWFYLDGNLVGSDVPVYLPAATYYLPPQVNIRNPVDGSTFFANELISLEGSVTGGMPPYTYRWTSSSDGYLGNTINVVSAIGSEIKGSTVFNPTVSFQVTDANGLTSTATISLNIKPAFWMPLIRR
jgi:Family of unknown function (DUF6345)